VADPVTPWIEMAKLNAGLRKFEVAHGSGTPLETPVR
jgi:hypothetical protein